MNKETKYIIKRKHSNCPITHLIFVLFTQTCGTSDALQGSQIFYSLNGGNNIISK